MKIAPQLIAKARELRDRYLERVNEQPLMLHSAGKYDVTRILPATTADGQFEERALRQLPVSGVGALCRLP